MNKSEQKYFRPSIILERHPEIGKCWTSNDIGMLLRMDLVKGYKLSRGCKVLESDVLFLFDKRKIEKS